MKKTNIILYGLFISAVVIVAVINFISILGHFGSENMFIAAADNERALLTRNFGMNGYWVVVLFSGLMALYLFARSVNKFRERRNYKKRNCF